jgi:hypothetical protein
MAKKSRAGRRRNTATKAWRIWRARFCKPSQRYNNGVEPGRLCAIKRKLTISAARNAKRNSPRVGVIVRRTSESRRAYDLWVKREGRWYTDYFPFDACILVDEDGAPGDDDILSPDEVQEGDTDDESDAEPDPEPTPRAPVVGRFRAPERRGVDRWAGE